MGFHWHDTSMAEVLARSKDGHVTVAWNHMEIGSIRMSELNSITQPG